MRTSRRSIAQVADELGLYDSTLGNWVRQAEIDDGDRDGLSSQDKARLAELERDNAKLRKERDLLKRTVAFLGEGVATLTWYRCVTDRKAEGYPVRRACEAAEVSPSAYYEWLNRRDGPTDAEWNEAHLINVMRDIHAESGRSMARRG